MSGCSQPNSHACQPTQCREPWFGGCRLLHPSAQEGSSQHRMNSRIGPVRTLKVEPHWLNLAVAIWLVAVPNFPFWMGSWRAMGGWAEGSGLFKLTFPLAIVAVTWVVIELATWGRFAKPVLMLLILISASASYFIFTFGIVVDKDMIANVIQTDVREAWDLATWRFALWVVFLGVLPAALLIAVTTPAFSARHFLYKGLAIALALSCVVVIVGFNGKSYASFLRNHRELRLQLVPMNALWASYGYVKRQLAAPPGLATVGLDAKARIKQEGAKPRVLVIVVGETARAANFSITGYERDTNPMMSADPDVLAFWDFRSCGTSTAVSLPCMFLDVGRDGFEGKLSQSRESLLDLLARAGVSVLWRDNNSGCKGVCDRVRTEDVSRGSNPGLCGSGECWDEILLEGLQERLRSVSSDTVIVLHMKGSHGPAYYLRFPPQFEHFKPVCRSKQLDQCDRPSIVNAYDNTIRYTDHVLSQTIALLKGIEGQVATAMVYVSDHGESLGENGLYLHGMPYGLAPNEQTAVPMLFWMSREVATAWDLDANCTRRQLNNRLTHDSLYHSTIGLMGVTTSIYRPEEDVFSPCRRLAGSTPAVR